MTPITLERIAERLAGHTPRRGGEAGSIWAAVALLLAPGASGQIELLLIKRAEQEGDPWSGQMALPGGRRDPHDADLRVTVTRETREEVGVEVLPQWLLGELDDLHPRTRTLPPVVVRPFVFGLSSRPAIHASREVASHVWVELDELASGQTRTQIEIPGRGTYPAYQVGDHLVWGMTERIITPLIDLVNDG